ncbi:MAG: 4'-phosphopantetheinyl transferase superfamily protein [Propionibacteriaceae bacterium]|nr:4'-phosphopantetheinyl transferase superfamily protein [Propionibacteriaceae bacterium]
MSVENQPLDVAIVGMSIFCPGASDVGAFWRNLAEGVDSTSAAPADVIEPMYFGATDALQPDHFYCNKGGFAYQAFADPLRFGYLPVAAESADPDQLFSLQMVEEALNDAGILEKGISLDNASVIVGRGNFSGEPQLRAAAIVRVAHEMAILLRSALPDLPEEDIQRFIREYQKSFGRYQGDTTTAMMPNLVASVVSNHWDMHGPAYTVDAACASGIVCLEQGITFLRTGQSDISIVGAMHLPQSAVFWSTFNMMGALSRKGVIAPFSQDADGLLIGQGGGFVVIKTLERAIADDDRIYAVIKATASGSDGGGHSVLITDTDGQSRVLRSAWQQAQMDPADVAYVETHGTGTLVGDATELQTLTKVFGDETVRKAYLGSVKSNVGHLMPAAGMMGLIKTSLALYHRQIPPTLHCENPLKAMSKSRFEPAQELLDWDDTGLPLIAGVDAFGFGGINSHAVLTAYEEPVSQQRRYRADRRRHLSPEVLAITAATQEGLLDKIDNERFKNQIGSWVGKPDDQFRLVVFNLTDERFKLAAEIVKRGQPWLGRNDIWYTNKPLLAQGGKVAFMFPGWDASGGVEHDSIVDELDVEWTQFDGDSPEQQAVADHYYTSMLVHDALEKSGVEADMYVGHSIGEWHAARADGLLGENFDQTAISFAKDPSLLLDMEKMEGIPQFSLVVVNGDSRGDKLHSVVDGLPDTTLITDNCPSQCVYCVAGEDTLDQFLKGLAREQVTYAVLPYASAIHTPYSPELVHVPDELAAAIRVQEGKKPFWSTAAACELSQTGQSASEVFGSLLAKPTLFREVVEKMYDEVEARVFIQVGVGSLNNFVDDILKGRDFAAIASVTPLRSSVDQLRRVHALLFVMGGHADLSFMGMSKVYQDFKSIFFLPKGSKLTINVPALNEALNSYVEDKAAQAVAAQPPVTISVPVPTPVPVPVPVPTPVAAPVTLNTRGLPSRGFTRPGSWAMPPADMMVPPVGAYPGLADPMLAAQLPWPQPGVEPVAGMEPPGMELPGLADAAPVADLPVVPVAMPDLTPQFAPVGPAAQPVPAEETPTPAVPAVQEVPFVRRAGTHFEVPLDLDLEKYPNTVDHSIVNQPPDWPRKTDLYPVVPLTMSMELMAEITMAQVPGLKVVQLGPMTAINFIPLNEPFHGTVKGFWKSDFTVSLTLAGYLQMEVTLADQFPEPPLDFVEQLEKDLGPDLMEPMTPEYQYTEFSFHRPRYWSLVESKRFTENGFLNTVTAREGKGSLLDQMGQAVGLFLHIRVPDNRVSFPVRVREVKFYQDMFDQEGLFESFCVIRQMTDTFITGDLAYLRDGKIWAIARNWMNQRVEMDTMLWEVVSHPWRTTVADTIAPGIFFFAADSPSRQVKSFLYLRYLAHEERERALEITTAEQQSDFLAGRVALKDGVRSTLKGHNSDLLYPIEISVIYDENGKPSVVYRGEKPFDKKIEVSIAHKDSRGVAAISENPVGIDIERIDAKEPSFWNLVFTDSEKALLETSPDRDEWAIRFWVAKEAYGKMLGEGLKGDPKRYVVDRIDQQDLYIGETRITTMIHSGTYVIGWTNDKSVEGDTHDGH